MVNHPEKKTGFGIIFLAIFPKIEETKPK